MKLEVNFSNCENYVEYSFHLPIGDLFYVCWDDDIPVPDGHEIEGIVKILEINVDLKKVEENYWLPINNVEVYHSHKDANTFLYLDLETSDYDQCEMIFIGVRCCKRVEKQILEILLRLYKKNSPRSNLNIDYFNYGLYLKVFRSEFYFYPNEKDRKMINYNLG